MVRSSGHILITSCYYIRKMMQDLRPCSLLIENGPAAGGMSANLAIHYFIIISGKYGDACVFRRRIRPLRAKNPAFTQVESGGLLRGEKLRIAECRRETRRCASNGQERVTGYPGIHYCRKNCLIHRRFQRVDLYTPSFNLFDNDLLGKARTGRKNPVREADEARPAEKIRPVATSLYRRMNRGSKYFFTPGRKNGRNQ